MGKLTTHVLDTTRGLPGQNITVTLYLVSDAQHIELNSVCTNADGRCDKPLLEGEEIQVGVYELVFAVGPYFKMQEANEAASIDLSGEPRFLDDVVIRFGISAPDQHYHVPLLISPFSYSTYRGS